MNFIFILRETVRDIIFIYYEVYYLYYNHID